MLEGSFGHFVSKRLQVTLHRYRIDFDLYRNDLYRNDRTPLCQYLLGMCRWHLRTLPHYSLFMVYFVANYRPYVRHFWKNNFLNLKVPKKVRPHSSNSVKND